MALTYRPPGVNVSEIVGTTVSPLLASPTTVCLVGPASGAITRSEQIVLQDGDADNNPVTPNAPVPHSFRSVPTDATLVAVSEVRDTFNGTLYVEGTDYTISSADKTITRLATGSIDDGTAVRVVLSYRPEDYFVAQRFSSIQDIEERFGSAWNATGTGIGSPVSHAALVALENGASSVVIAPLYTESSGVRSAPTPAENGQVATWQTTLNGLRDFSDINMIVPVVGQFDHPTDNTLDISSGTVLQIFQAVQDHVWYMQTQDQFVMAVCGEDSSQGVTVSSATMINHAVALSTRYGGDVSDCMVVVSPAKFVRGALTANETFYVGGQYAAAAYAGALASRRVEATLTRKPLTGLLQVAENRTKDEKNAEAQNGISVIENRGALVRVRHAITTDTSSVSRSEVNVVRAKHFMVESLYDTFETQVIGMVASDTDATDIVRSTTIASLERLRALGVFARYRDVDVRILANNPTALEVRFSYQPLVPINFIDIIFSVDFSQGTITNIRPGAGVI